ncbi:unnamed protein product [Rotaria sordida]|uniref:Uncharacterized protein n=1 Tax=Rotaria sordida TaxID=392033 RepID=A0A815JAI5_9BILA|nr:unnamed protein product [Rotaria sordida]
MLYSPIREANFFIIWCHGNGDDIGSIGMAMNALSQRIQAHVMAFEYPSYGLCKGPIDPYSPIREANFFIIWCHGKGDDIGSIGMAMNALSQRIQAHVMAFEYPSYGLCKGPIDPTEETINNHAERAYLFARDIFRWPPNRILVYGHSMGSGPACHLAATKVVGGLILKSPYKSLSNLIQEKIWIFSKLLSSPNWNNLEAMKHIRCPILIIHGQRDSMIPFYHSQTLYNSLNHNEKKRLVSLPNDDHSSIPDSIFYMHVELFVREYFPSTTEPMPQVEIPSALFHPPPMI